MRLLEPSGALLPGSLNKPGPWLDFAGVSVLVLCLALVVFLPLVRSLILDDVSDTSLSMFFGDEEDTDEAMNIGMEITDSD